MGASSSRVSLTSMSDTPHSADAATGAAAELRPIGRVLQLGLLLQPLVLDVRDRVHVVTLTLAAAPTAVGEPTDRQQCHDGREHQKVGGNIHGNPR